MKTAKYLAAALAAVAVPVAFACPLAAACMAGYAGAVWFVVDVFQAIDRINAEMLKEARRMNDILEQQPTH